LLGLNVVSVDQLPLNFSTSKELVISTFWPLSQKERFSGLEKVLVKTWSPVASNWIEGRATP
jgi:hypothetical protein